MIYNTLHFHTGFSHDGVSTVSDVSDYLYARGETFCCCTEHGHLYSSYILNKFQGSTFDKVGHGIEFYVTLTELGVIYHLTVIAKNKVGFDSIVSCLNSELSYINRGRHIVPDVVLFELLRECYILSGCPASPFQRMNRGSYYDTVINRFMSIPTCDFIVEVMAHGEHSIGNVRRSLSMIEDYGLPSVLTNDSHYLDPSHKNVHEFRLKCKGFTYDNTNLHLRTNGSILQTLSSLGVTIPGIVERTQALVTNLETYDLTVRTWALPDLGYANEHEEFLAVQEKAYNFAAMMGINTEEVRARLDYELNIVKAVNLSRCMLILYEISDMLTDAGVIHSLRGSAAGLMLAYVGGLSRVNPLMYGIMPDRCISEHRVDIFDFDLDVSDRPKAKEVIFSRWPGYQVMTFITFRERSIFRAADRFNLDVPENWEVLLETTQTTGTHAAAIVLSADDIEELPRRNGMIAAGALDVVKFDILGLNILKVISIVSESVGDITDAMLRINGKVDSIAYGYHSAVVTHFKHNLGVWQLNKNAGVELARLIVPFMPNLEGLALTSAANRPATMANDYHTLIVQVLSGTYVGDATTYPKPFQHIFEKTHVLVYQEQFMTVFAIAFTAHEMYENNEPIPEMVIPSGYALELANQMRKILTKGSKIISEKPAHVQEKYYKMIEMFESGCWALGISDAEVAKLRVVLENSISYLFNMAHAFAYAGISAITLYAKALHTSVFYAAYMSVYGVDKYNKGILFREMAYHNIRMVKPSINLSSTKYEVVAKQTIMPPLSVVKGIGSLTAQKIYKEREANGKFTSFEDGTSRCGRAVFGKKLKRLLDEGLLSF